MVCTELKINYFLKIAKKKYKNIFTEDELKDIYKFYNNEEQEYYFPLREDLTEFWKHYNNFDEMFDDLTEEWEKNECKTKKSKTKLMNEIMEQNYHYYKYKDGSYLVCLQFFNHDLSWK